ncbi:MAG: hypothetical protein ACT6Q8_24185 [Niveispirillum sp.]|uniref:hypothetical protein n=1 Tax=Niveispirillum sp. TaxID=1917217 RepID=UPI004036CC03
MTALIARILSYWQVWAVLVAAAAVVAHLLIVGALRADLRSAQAATEEIRLALTTQTAAIHQMRADADRRAARAAERALREIKRPPQPPPQTVDDLNRWMGAQDGRL